MNQRLAVRDPLLLVLSLVLSIMGLVMVFDITYVESLREQGTWLAREAVIQCIAVAVGVVLALAVSWMPITRMRRLATPLWWLATIALALTLVPGVGTVRNGSRRWLEFGPLSVQPSEFAKVAIILFVAAVMADRARWPRRRKRFRTFSLWMDCVAVPKLKRCLPAAWVLIPAFLIAQEPDLGTAFAIVATAFVMFFVGGATIKTLAVGALLATVVVGGYIVKEPFRMQRFEVYFQPWNPELLDGPGYQTSQSQFAMATGGAFGQGIGVGRAKHVLPAAGTDFVMATVAEELGFVGVLVFLAVLAGIVLRLFYLSAIAPTAFGSLFLCGVGSWLAIQGALNVMQANGAFPAIGIPFPLVSAGGSSMVAIWIALGLCQAALSPVAETVTAGEIAGHRRRDRGARVPRARSRPAGA